MNHCRVREVMLQSSRCAMQYIEIVCVEQHSQGRDKFEV